MSLAECFPPCEFPVSSIENKLLKRPVCAKLMACELKIYEVQRIRNMLAIKLILNNQYLNYREIQIGNIKIRDV